MTFALVRRWLPALWLVATACASASPAVVPDASGPPVETLRFDADGILTLGPGDSLAIGVTAIPAVHEVLVTLVGDYGDASIDTSRLALERGHATFKLHASTVPATFALRASSDAPLASARLDVAVGRDGFGTIRVTPHYQGSRPAPAVWGSAFLKGSCKDLAKGPPKDGAPLVASSVGVPFDLKSVPVGGNVAVSVRIRHYSAGCADVADLAAGTTRALDVNLYDLGLDTTALDLEARLTFTPSVAEQTAWDVRLASAVEVVMSKVAPVGTPQDDATRLLDAMATSAQNAAFAAARGSGGWDTKAAAWLGQHPSIRTSALGWLDAGKAASLTDELLHIGAGPGDQQATLALALVGAGFSADVPFSLVADAGDTLRLEGPLAVQPTAVVTYRADVRAALDVAQASDVPSALAIRIDCAGLAQSLIGGQTYAYGGCNAACMTQLCAAGLSAIWKGAHDASQQLGDTTTIVLNASGATTVGEYAEPAAFSGPWIGQVKGGAAAPSTLHGVLKAAKGKAPN